MSRWPAMTLEERFWGKVDKSGANGCWLWTSAHDSHGYGRFFVSIEDKKHAAHRLSWVLCGGEEPADREICHRCDNPQCVNPAHLFLGTHLDNVRDAATKGRLGSWKRRLTDEQFREIETAPWFHGITEALAAKYGVGQQTISRIRNGKQRRSQPNWKGNTRYPFGPAFQKVRSVDCVVRGWVS